MKPRQVPCGQFWIADYIVDWLNRPLLAAAMTREGKDQRIPNTIRGPKVMLISQYAGSGGDALPWMFKRLGEGPLVGTRPWGGLIGIGGYPRLMDGGTITASARRSGRNPYPLTHRIRFNRERRALVVSVHEI